MKLGDMLNIRKNIILCIIYIITIFLTFYFCLLYKNSSTNIVSSEIDGFISNVTDDNYDKLFDNIKNYSNEYDEFYLYVASYKKIDLSSFEERLRNIVLDNNIKNIIYINYDELKNGNYLQMLISDFGFSGSYKFDNLPIIIVFRNGYIVDIYNIYQKNDIFLKNLMGGNND